MRLEEILRSKRLLILGALAMAPAFGQVSSAPDLPQADVRSARQHGPIRIREQRDDGTVTSSNWSGYAVTGSSFTSAKGSWIVPAAKCSSGNQYAAFWVGIDGYSSTTVEQTGTDSDCVGSTPRYYAWYEFYPHPSYSISTLKISPGDRMSAQVVYSGSAFSKSSTVRGAKRSSAGWIAEAPSSASVLPLADFGTVLFGEDSTGITGTCEATMGGKAQPIGSFSTIEEITMENSSKVKEAIPSGLSSDGTSFSVTWAAQ